MARFSQEFTPLAADAIHEDAAARKADGWRYVQTLAVNTEEGIDLIYSYMRDGLLENRVVKALPPHATVPSVTDEFLAAFVFENEIHDLFGISFEGLAIDFGGNFYRVAQPEPMTIISPELKAAREKAAKLAAAKAAKAERAEKAGEAQAEFLAAHPEAKAAGTGAGKVLKPSDDEAVEAKLAGMDPEKVARVRAAIAAKAKKAAEAEQAAKDAELEAKLAAMDPEKAAKVRAAMEAKAARAAAAGAKEGE